MTLGLAVLMLARLGASPERAYGSFKLQLFLAENVTFVVAGILVARQRRHLNLWAGFALATASLGALVLLRGLVSGGLQDVLPGRFALYAQAGPIPLARGAATGILIAVFVLLAAPAAWKRAVGLALVPVLGIAFIGAGSRGPVLGLAVGLLILLALTFRDRLSRRRLVLLGVALVASAVLIPQLVPGQNVTRSLSVLVGGGRDVGGGDVSNGRIQLWNEAWRTFGDHTLGGIGTGGFARVNPVGIYPHNLFLEAASELGILGLALTGGLIALGFFYALRAWSRSEGEDRRHAALVTAFLGAAVVNALFSGDFTNNATVWLGAGMALGLLQRVAPSSPEQEPLRRLRTRWRRHGSGEPEPIGPGALRPAPKPPVRTPGPARGGGGGGITVPSDGATVRGEIVVAAVPAGTGWTVGSVVIERSIDGRDWVELGEAAPDEDYEVFVVGHGGARRHVAIVRSLRRAEQMRSALASEHGVKPEQVELRAAKKRTWNARELREAGWDTKLVEDGLHRLRAVTTDVTGRSAASPEITVMVDNAPPSVHVDTPRPGAVLMGVVEVSATARDTGSGVALVRFELSADGADWREIGSSAASPFRTSWNTGLLGEGDYQLRAVARDRAGNEAVGRELVVRVERVVAAVKLADPGESLSRIVRLKASVRDEARTSGVEFQIAPADTFSWHALGAVAQAPFELDVDTSRLEDGTYDLRAVSRSEDGAIDASRILHRRLVDNLPPTVSLYEPGPGAVVRGDVPLSARAADTGSGVSSVLFQFSTDGTTWRPVVTNGQGPSQVYWHTERVEDGEYRLRAVVADGAGNLASSESVTVLVDNTAPEVALEEPQDGLELGGTVRLRAAATDEGSGVIAVRFECSPDGSLWNELATATTTPYRFSWDTLKVADGTYRLRAVARDRAGNSTFSETIELRVRNTLELIAPPAPEPVAASEPGPVAEAPAPAAELSPRPAVEAATLWQLERLLRERGSSLPNREEVEALLYTLRPYARPDGTIPERFWPLLWESFEVLLRG